MIFTAKLSIDGGPEVEVLQANYALDRDTDRNGQPSTTIRAGKITVTVKSSSSTSLFEWMINPFATKGGKIDFYKHNDPTPSKTLTFENAFIVGQSENFNVMDGEKDSPMTETFTVSAESIAMNDASYKNIFTM